MLPLALQANSKFTDAHKHGNIDCFAIHLDFCKLRAFNGTRIGLIKPCLAGASATPNHTHTAPPKIFLPWKTSPFLSKYQSHHLSGSCSRSEVHGQVSGNLWTFWIRKCASEDRICKPLKILEDAHEFKHIRNKNSLPLRASLTLVYYCLYMNGAFFLHLVLHCVSYTMNSWVLSTSTMWLSLLHPLGNWLNIILTAYASKLLPLIIFFQSIQYSLKCNICAIMWLIFTTSVIL